MEYMIELPVNPHRSDKIRFRRPWPFESPPQPRCDSVTVPVAGSGDPDLRQMGVHARRWHVYPPLCLIVLEHAAVGLIERSDLVTKMAALGWSVEGK